MLAYPRLRFGGCVSTDAMLHTDDVKDDDVTVQPAATGMTRDAVVGD